MDELLKTIFGMVAIALGGLLVMLFFLWIISLLSGSPKNEEEEEEEAEEEEEEKKPKGNAHIIVWGILFICGGLIFFLIGYNNYNTLKDVVVNNVELLALSSSASMLEKEMKGYLFFEIFGAILTVIGVVLVFFYFQKNKKTEYMTEYHESKRKKEKCLYCKTKLDKDDDFCSKCGRKV